MMRATITDRRLEAIAGNPAATNQTPGTSVPTNLSALQDRTIYAAVQVTNRDSNFGAFARLGHTLVADGAVSLQTHASGTANFLARLDTLNGSTNATRTIPGRDPGLRILWASISTNMTRGHAGTNTGTQTGIDISLTPGSGMLENPSLSLTSQPGLTALAAFAFAGAHDEQLRSRIVAWLWRRFGGSPPPLV